MGVNLAIELLKNGDFSDFLLLFYKFFNTPRKYLKIMMKKYIKNREKLECFLGILVIIRCADIDVVRPRVWEGLSPPPL